MANIQNLKPCKPGETHNPKGRPRSLAKAMKGLPPEARAEVLGVLYTAITLPNMEQAEAYIKDKAATGFKYGLILQIALKALKSKNGWMALNDILDRLFGKPRLSAEVQHTGGINLQIYTDDQTGAAITEGLE